MYPMVPGAPSWWRPTAQHTDHARTQLRVHPASPCARSSVRREAGRRIRGEGTGSGRFRSIWSTHSVGVMTEHSGECAARNRDQCRRGRITTSANPRPPRCHGDEGLLEAGPSRRCRRDTARDRRDSFSGDAGGLSWGRGRLRGRGTAGRTVRRRRRVIDRGRAVGGCGVGGTTEELVDDVVEPTGRCSSERWWPQWTSTSWTWSSAGCRSRWSSTSAAYGSTSSRWAAWCGVVVEVSVVLVDVGSRWCWSTWRRSRWCWWAWRSRWCWSRWRSRWCWSDVEVSVVDVRRV